ncbi:NitT/TauT family transport system ATP-binding protein [Cellulomonas oligotrophica]|uniref:NitT/TauT family transport system ATP-binding protein n=1 Tax=Cellulomonas oligotrophica TaxID=931536 RepID=A0A7Y9JZM5_9CELL|nr:NitT/TauT family transport system ATP-binding protein [Cellulomonas oligotrophica]GIG33560.1 sulfonate ABC transporter ATP-binding lipoprotein [Cellulomonas oligotrophica]
MSATQQPDPTGPDTGPHAGTTTTTDTTGAGTTTAAVAVRAEHVTRTFGRGDRQVVALQDVDLTVGAGEFVSLIGPSGCGKSTLLRLVADLDTPTSGTVEVFGRSAREARLARDYGIAFQQAGLLPWRTVRANVELPLQLAGTGRAGRRARAEELLALVGLTDFADHHPDQLSGGMQQRVAIARALADEPSLLLMDEPFGALDEMTREHLQAQLLRICAETRAAVVFVTHSIPEAVFLSDRVVVMSPRPGQIREIVDVGLDRHAAALGGSGPHDDTGDDLRNDAAFFAAVARVRDALHAGQPGAAPAARGVDVR